MYPKDISCFLTMKSSGCHFVFHFVKLSSTFHFLSYYFQYSPLLLHLFFLWLIVLRLVSNLRHSVFTNSTTERSDHSSHNGVIGKKQNAKDSRCFCRAPEIDPVMLKNITAYATKKAKLAAHIFQKQSISQFLSCRRLRNAFAGVILYLYASSTP